MIEAAQTLNPKFEAVFRSAKAAPVLMIDDHLGRIIVLTRARFHAMVTTAGVDTPKAAHVPRADGEDIVMVQDDIFGALIKALRTVRPITSKYTANQVWFIE